MRKKLILLIMICAANLAYADTINVNWTVDGNTYDTSTCTVGGDLNVPSTPPTKYGYTFKGWSLQDYIINGTVAINGTPGPSTPVYPTFYTNGDLVLRKINDTYYDTLSVEIENTACRNLFDGQWRTGLYDVGVYKSNNNRICNTNMIAVKPSTSYSVSCPNYNLGGGMRWYYYDANKNYISSASGETTITTPAAARYMNFFIANNLTTATAPDLQIEKGSTPTTYVPYYAPGTCPYGDSITTTWVITRRVGVKVLDGTEDWVQSDTKNDVYRLVSTDVKREQQAILSTHFIGTSAADVNMPSNSIKIGSYAAIPNYGVIAIRLTDVTTLADFKTFLADQYAAGTPVTIYYPLANPFTEIWEH